MIFCYYDARIGVSPYAGMFNPLTLEPFPLYYAFKAFNELYKLKNQVESTLEGEEKGIYTLAAEQNGKKAVLIVNASEKDEHIITNLPADMQTYIVDNKKT